jgi:tRNA(Ile2) C34 agmatinyltransferase TiaS
MQLIRWGAAKTSADVMSGILNCVCPECGGSMGGFGREFKCQGECQTDWRQLWGRIVSAGVNQPTPRQPADLI